MEGLSNKIKNFCFNETFISFVSSIGAIVLSNIFLVGVNSSDIDMNDNIVVEEVVDNSLEDIVSEKTVTQERTLVEKSYDNEYNYSGMALSNEFEDEIKKIAQEYDVDYQIVLTVGERESGGKWNNNGVISKTNDYGVFQINQCNLDYIEKNLGYTKDEVLHEPIKNAESCIYLLTDIINREEVDTLEEIFGMYNGWVRWDEKSQSVEYSNACCDIISDYFEDYQYIKKKTY